MQRVQMKVAVTIETADLTTLHPLTRRAHTVPHCARDVRRQHRVHELDRLLVACAAPSRHEWTGGSCSCLPPAPPAYLVARFSANARRRIRSFARIPMSGASAPTTSHTHKYARAGRLLRPTSTTNSSRLPQTRRSCSMKGTRRRRVAVTVDSTSSAEARTRAWCALSSCDVMVCHCNETHLGSRSAATRGAGSSTPSTQSTPGMKDARARRANSSPHSCTNYCEMRASTGTSHPVKPMAPTRRCDGREFGTYVHALSHCHEDDSGYGCHKPQHHFLCLRGQLIERDWARQQTSPAGIQIRARSAPPHIALSLQREAH